MGELPEHTPIQDQEQPGASALTTADGVPAAAYGGRVDHSRTLTASQFPGDDGQANASTRHAMDIASAPTSTADYLRAVAALCLDRVLVPVVATATSVGTTSAGLVGDKEAEMAVVLLQTQDGRRAMLAFTGLDSLQAWDATARPVPVTLDLAAQSATADGAAALLVDFAGPHPLVIEGDVLGQLALGHRLVEIADGEFGWAMSRSAREEAAPQPE